MSGTETTSGDYVDSESFSDGTLDAEGHEEEDEDSSDDEDVVSDAIVEVRLGRAPMDLGDSDSEYEYGRDAYFTPFSHDLILEHGHRDRYAQHRSGDTYKLAVPKTGYQNLWIKLFHATGSSDLPDVLEYLLRDKERLGRYEATHPTNREFPFPKLSEAAQDEVRKGILHHIVDHKCATNSCRCIEGMIEL
jgi:hypothetical protein